MMFRVISSHKHPQSRESTDICNLFSKTPVDPDMHVPKLAFDVVGRSEIEIT